MNVYIVGYMGAGKTRLGSELADDLGYECADLDLLFEEKFRISVNDFFLKYGEDAFRQLEQQLLQKTGEIDNTVISTGGGTPCFFDNMDFMNRTGITIYLRQPVSALVERLLSSKQKRPLLNDIGPDEMFDFISRHIEEREKFYLRSDIISEGKNTPAIAEMVLENLKSKS